VTILVIGREGQLARALVEAAERDGIELTALGRPSLDLTDAASIEPAVRELRPKLVVNAAAYTAVDKAVSDPDGAFAVNAVGAEGIAKACAAHDIPVIHVSTDYVFDGAKSEPYCEDDPTNPINIYGHSKLEGEQRIASACAQHLILRTAWVHSPWGSNFVKTMLRLARSRPSINVVGDQLGCPTYAPHLADIILAIAGRAIDDPASVPWGIYHAVGRGETTWAAFAQEVFRCAPDNGLPVAEVVSIETAGYPTPARRPMNSRLDCEKLKSCFGLSLPNWRTGVQDCVARLSGQGAA